MSSISEVAEKFFDACETGKGWEGCKDYCNPDATFAAHAEPLTEVKTVEQYADWMKGICALMPDGKYVVKSLAVDAARNNVCVFGVLTGTHTEEGGPVPPTGKTATVEYVYVMDFDGDKIKHMTKVWNSGWTLKELGWAS